MRGTFVRTLIDLAAADERIVLLTGDLGYMALEPFIERFPSRFFNVGVAEQNMTGIATGLADAGRIPFVYSIATFATLRPYEFIRNGPIAHQLPVRIVGIGGGFEYGTQGLTHHALEDVGVLRVQPGITIVVPADAAQAASALQATWDLPGPVYYRVGKDDRAVVAGLDGRFALGRIEEVRSGRDAVLLASGAIATEALAAAGMLSSQGIDAAVYVVAGLQPAPAEALATALGDVPFAVTVEAHSVVGGLGSLVAEVIAERSLACRLVRCGVRSTPDGVSGSQAFMQTRHGIDAEGLAASVRRALGRPAAA